MIYLLLAIVWFLAGILLLAWDWWYPGVNPYRLPGTELSPGWLALLLAIYNVVRYWARRSAARRQEISMRQRRSPHRNQSSHAADPDFNFLDESSSEPRP